jgi:hypothetical protein
MTSKNFNTNTKTIITKSLNLKTMKTMKTNYFKNTLKLGMTAIFIISLGTANAQTTDATDSNLLKDAGVGTSVRVIDNKGTIKYLQTNNGISSITSTTAANTTTTTWQLGGTLTDDTYIDASGNLFAIDGIALATGIASVNAVTGEVIKGATPVASGYTILVRDEATGATQKLLATDLITAGRAEQTISANAETSITASGLASGTSINKISVYRNGSKLRASTDYTLSAANTILLNLGAAAPNDWNTLIGDIIEVQWVY